MSLSSYALVLQLLFPNGELQEPRLISGLTESECHEYLSSSNHMLLVTIATDGEGEAFDMVIQNPEASWRFHCIEEVLT